MTWQGSPHAAPGFDCFRFLPCFHLARRTHVLLHSRSAVVQVHIKVIPSCTGGRHEIAQLVRGQYTDVKVHSAHGGPARLDLIPHANCLVADFPVRRIISGESIVADVTMAAGTVLHDYVEDLRQAKA